MNALNVITLQQAKDYLVVDFNDRDAEIERHIKTAVSYVEQYTNVMLYEREKVYPIGSRCSVEIYDYPIRFSSAPLKSYQNVMSVQVYGEAGSSVTATVGYAVASDVPEELISAAYKLITYLFENRDIYTAGLPWDVALLLNSHRRSATF